MLRILDLSKGPVPEHVFLNGEDVSNRCYLSIVPAEVGVEGPGQVWLYKHNAEGHFYTEGAGDSLEAAREVRCGMVRWELPA